jgi:hypothetical protein
MMRRDLFDEAVWAVFYKQNVCAFVIIVLKCLKIRNYGTTYSNKLASVVSG